jgi:ferrous iron transport protein B
MEMGIPSFMALNMMDVAEKKGISIDVSKLEQILAVPVIPMVARKNIGHDTLIAKM